ncbi:hypothetical protein JCM19992_26240 [Thermostilla marina]
MKRILAIVSGTALFTLFATASVLAAPPTPEEQAAALQGPPAADRVVACYFHRTQRCPTCMRVGNSIADVLVKKYGNELKQGVIQWTLMDFQSPKNAGFTRYYRIGRPTLVLMLVRDGKVAAWKKADKVWTLLADEEKFSHYLTDEITPYLEQLQSASARTSEPTR